jgi:hypothetical protein
VVGLDRDPRIAAKEGERHLARAARCIEGDIEFLLPDGHGVSGDDA